MWGAGFSLQVASLIAEHGPWGMQASVAAALGSVALAPGLSCSVACGVFPDQGSNLSLLHWQVDAFPRPAREASYNSVLNVYRFRDVKGSTQDSIARWWQNWALNLVH